MPLKGGDKGGKPSQSVSSSVPGWRAIAVAEKQVTNRTLNKGIGHYSAAFQGCESDNG